MLHGGSLKLRPSPSPGHCKRVVAGADGENDIGTFETEVLDVGSLGERVTAFGDGGH